MLRQIETFLTKLIQYYLPTKLIIFFKQFTSKIDIKLKSLIKLCFIFSLIEQIMHQHLQLIG